MQPHFDILAYTGNLLHIGWSRPVVFDLAGLRPRNKIVATFDGPRDQIVGQGQAHIANGQLTVSGRITGNLADPKSAAAIVLDHAKRGFQWGAALSVAIQQIASIDKGQQVLVNGRQYSGPIYVARAADFAAVAFVAVPVDESSVVQILGA